MRLKTMLVGYVLVAGIMGCSREDRNEILDRINDAGKSLNGESAGSVPGVVREQRRKERIRQDTHWTPENINAHPKEYCLSQIEYIDKLSRNLGGLLHELSVLEVQMRQELKDAKIMKEQITKFSDDAIAAYKNAMCSNQWPVLISGFSLSQVQLKRKIIEAAQQRRELDSKMLKRENQIVKFKKKIEVVAETERRLAATRAMTQSALRDIEINDALGVDKGIVESLKSINASVEVLDSSQDDPSVEELARPSVDKVNDLEFEAILKGGN